MALRERFGRLVLLEETETGPLGHEYRAARLGPAGLDRLVSVFCFGPAVSSHAAATKRLMEEARLAARLQNPGLVRVLGIGRVEQTFYVSTELVEGRPLAVILGRCSHDSFPFAADHALMVASRAASALEYLHSKRDDAGRALFHGLLAPGRLVVAFDGEVKIRGLGLWPALLDTNLLPEGETDRLAPEQRSGGGDPRSDVYALGLILLEALAGGAQAGDPLAALPTARVVTVSGESQPLPKPLGELLAKALAPEPAARFQSMVEMRKAIDTLLFSGDFTPTTFDLAFFMHTLFRDEMERESRALDEARRADYREFVEERAPSQARAAATVSSASAPTSAAPAPQPAAASPAPAITPAPAPASRDVAAETDDRAQPASPPSPEAIVPPPALASAGPATGDTVHVQPEERTGPVAPAAAGQREPAAASPREPVRSARETTARELAPRLGLEQHLSRPTSRRGLWIALGLAGVAGLAAGGWLYLGRRAPATSSTTSTTLSPQVQAAMARVKELEGRIAQMERERAEAEAKAAEEARQKLEAQAASKGRRVDPAALQKAQEEARQRARAEQERKQQEERTRIAEARRTEEKRIADASPSPPLQAPATPTPAMPTPAAPAATTQPTPTPEPTTAVPTSATAATPTPSPSATAATAQPTTPGMAVDASDPRLVRPVLVRETAARYPPAADVMRVSGSVELVAVIDETGHVSEANVLRVKPEKMGFEQEALRHVRSRVYRPGTRDGVPVKVRMVIVVKFSPR